MKAIIINIFFTTLLAAVLTSGTLVSASVNNFTHVLVNNKSISIVWTDTITGMATSYWGIIEGEPLSLVTLSNYNNHISMIVQSPELGDFQYNSQTGSFDEMILPPLNDDVVYFEGQELASSELKTTGVETFDNDSIVDVLFLYTKESKDLFGGLSALISKVETAVNNSNNNFKNSAINTRLRLVQLAEVDYKAAGNIGTDLNRLANKTDGYMDDIHKMREEAGADVVSLVSDKDNAKSYGIARILTSEAGQVNTGFNVCYYETIAGVFPHEIGHNLGCQHNKEYGGAKLYSFSYGHHFTYNGQERGTMMSYIGRRFTRFSNPDSLWNGIATGVVNEADNAQTINRSGPVLANYFPSRIVVDATLSVDTLNSNTLNYVLTNKSSVAAKNAIVKISLPQGVVINELSNNASSVTLSNDTVYIGEISSSAIITFTLLIISDASKDETPAIRSELKYTKDYVDYNLADNVVNTIIQSSGNSVNVNGISQNKAIIHLYQNIFTDYFTLTADEPVAIQIVNLSGQVIYSETLHGSVTLGQELQEGVFILRASNSRGSISRKIVKY